MAIETRPPFDDERDRGLKFLADAGALLASSLDYDTTLAAVARLAVPFLADWCAVDIVDAGEIRRREVLHADPAKVAWLREGQDRYLAPPDALCGVPNVVRTGKPEFYPEISPEATVCDAEPVWADRFLGSRSALIVPLLTRGRTLGAITLVMAGSGRRYTPADLALAEEFARRAAVAVENAALYAAEQRIRQAMQRAAERLERLQQITAALSEARTSAEVAEVILDQGLAALGANAGVVSALTPDGSRLRCLGITGYAPEVAQIWADVPVEAPLPIAEAVRTGEALVFETLEARNGRYPDLTHLRAIGGDGALVALPLLFHGRTIGGLRLGFPEARSFGREDRAFLRTLAEMCAQALERARWFDAAQEEIAERRRAEAALRESQERFAKIFRSSPAVISIATLPEERFVDVNESFLRSLGFRRDEVIGRTAAELGMWVDPQDHLRVFEALLEQRSVPNIELPCRMRSGEIRDTLTSMELIELGGEPCILATGLDITERKRIEAALGESRERFSLVFQASPLPISISTLDEGRFIDVNDSFLRQFGYVREEVVGHTVVELGLWKPEDRAALARRLRQQRSIRDLEITYRTRAGERRTALAYVEIIRLNGEECLLGLMHDITERKQAEEALRVSTEALRESEERFRSAFDNAAIGMALVGVDGRFLQVNRSLCEFVGYAPEELLATDFQSVTHPDDLDLDLGQVRRVLAGEIRTFQMEKRYLHKRGHVVRAQLSVSTVRDGDDRPLYFISQIQDITGRKPPQSAA